MAAITYVPSFPASVYRAGADQRLAPARHHKFHRRSLAGSPTNDGIRLLAILEQGSGNLHRVEGVGLGLRCRAEAALVADS
jgi:hypothetical protein